MSAPPSMGTATRRKVGKGRMNARTGNPPWRPRASGSTQQKVQKSVVMEKKNNITSAMRNHSPSHEELIRARNGRATATVVVAQRLRDQSSQAMAVVGVIGILPHECGTPTMGWMRRTRRGVEREMKNEKWKI